MHVRYCEECGETFLPHVVQCSDCGALLKDKWEEEDPPEPPPLWEGRGERPALPYPPGDYRLIGEMSSADADNVARELAARRIPVKVEPAGRELRVSVRDEDRAAAVTALVEAGLLAKPDEPATPTLATEGGPCPACDTHVPAGSSECPECSLVLSGEPPVCEKCGSETVLSGECNHCGHSSLEK